MEISSTMMENIMGRAGFTDIKNLVLKILNLRLLLGIQVEMFSRLWLYEYEIHGRISY